MVYEWAAGISAPEGMSPDQVGKELDRLKQRTGSCEARDIVKLAKNPINPLHRWFTWDNTKAADLHREYEARRLARSVVVIRSEAEGNGPPVKAFVSLAEGRRNPGYESTLRVMQDSTQREVLVEKFFRDLRAVMDRYSYLQELQPVIEEIQQIVEEETVA